MPTADKVVIEFDANIKTFVTKTIQATKVYESHSQSIQKNSIAAKNFLNKSQKGQTAILERSAKSFEQAQKTITAGMRRSVTEQVTVMTAGTKKIIKNLDEQKKAKTVSAELFESSIARIKKAFANVSLEVLIQQGIAYKVVYDDLSGTMSSYVDVLGNTETAISQMAMVASEAGLPLQNLEKITGAAARSVREFGGTSDDVTAFGELVAKGASLTKTSARSIEAAMDSVSAVIESPVVSLGDFNDVIQNSPRLAEAFANGIDGANGSIDDLQRLVANGEVSGGNLFDALLSQGEAIRTEFSTLEQGPKESLARLQNGLVELVGTSEIAIKASEGFATVVDFLADNIDVLADAIIVAGAAATGLFGAQGFLAATKAAKGLVGSLFVVNAATGATTFSLRAGAVAAKGFIASLGPIGVLVTAVTAGAAAFLALATRTKEAQINHEDFRKTLNDLSTVTDDIKKDEARLKELTDATTKSIRAQGDAAEEARDKEINALSQRIKENKELAEVYRTLAVAQLAAGEAEEQKIINEQRKLTRLTRHVLPSEFGAHPLDEKPAAFDKRRDEEILKIVDQANQKRKDGIKLSSKEHKLLESVAKLAKLRATNKSNEIRIQEFDKLEATPTDVDVDGGPDLEALEKYRKSEEKIEADLRKARALGAEQEIERANEKLEIIKRTIELINEGARGDQANRIAKDELGTKGSSGGGGVGREEIELDNGSSDHKEAERIKSVIDQIQKLGEIERDQIEQVLQLRLDAIEKSQEADGEKKRLRNLAHQDALSDIAELQMAEAASAAQQFLEAEQQKQSNFEAHQAQLKFQAEIEASRARMAGRAMDAAEIELEATRAAYLAELGYIDEVIAKTEERVESRKKAQAEVDRLNAIISSGGGTPKLRGDLEAAQETLFNIVALIENSPSLKNLKTDRAEVESKVVKLDEASLDEGRQKLTALDGELSPKDDKPKGLKSKLDDIDKQEQERLDLIKQYQDTELGQQFEFEQLKTQIIRDAEEERRKVRIDALQMQLDQTQEILGGLTTIFKAAGLENTKAAKIAAKAQQGIALGRAAVNTAVAVTEAAQALPFPLNIPGIAFAAATGAAQIATIAAQTFRDGGVNILGPGTGTSDSIPARISRGESVITAAATRGNEAGLLGLNNGLSPADAFGLPVIHPPMPNLSVPSISSSSGNRNFRSGDVIIQGNVDRETMPNFLAALADRDRKFSSNVNRIIDARERRTISRRERVLGR